MAVLRNEGRWDRGNVIYQPGRVMLYDKAAAPGMQYIDYGLSCFRRDLFDQPTPSDLAILFHDLSLQGRLAGFRVYERFYEIGSPAGLRDFEQYMAADHAPHTWYHDNRRLTQPRGGILDERCDSYCRAARTNPVPVVPEHE